MPCQISANRGTIYERIGDGKRDVIRSYGNFDRLHANTYSNDIDRVSASGGGTNYLFVNDGDTLDTAVGARGQFIYNNYYKCFVDSKAEAGPGCARVLARLFAGHRHKGGRGSEQPRRFLYSPNVVEGGFSAVRVQHHA